MLGHWLVREQIVRNCLKQTQLEWNCDIAGTSSFNILELAVI